MSRSMFSLPGEDRRFDSTHGTAAGSTLLESKEATKAAYGEPLRTRVLVFFRARRARVRECVERVAVYLLPRAQKSSSLEAA